MLNNNILYIFGALFINCFAAEVKLQHVLITKQAFPYCIEFLTEEEVDSWNNAETQDVLKENFIHIFYIVKDFCKEVKLRVNSLVCIFNELDLLEKELKLSDTSIDEKILEIKEEISELKETILKNKRIQKFPLRFNRRSKKFTLPPISIQEEWNNAITTIEQKRILCSMMFSVYMAIKMGIILDKNDIIKAVQWLNGFRQRVGISHKLSNEIQNELNEIAMQTESDLLDEQFGAIKTTD